jgi:uncharacterized protein
MAINSGTSRAPSSRLSTPTSFACRGPGLLRRAFQSLLDQSRRTKPDSRLRIVNLTRKIELAGWVEVADCGAKRRKGLLGRESLASAEGLWIVPCQAVHTFGMRFAIDLIYLDRKLEVRKVKSNVVPWRLSGCLFAHSVIELASGTIGRTQTRPGDRLETSSVSPQPGSSRKAQA